MPRQAHPPCPAESYRNAECTCPSSQAHRTQKCQRAMIARETAEPALRKTRLQRRRAYATRNEITRCRKVRHRHSIIAGARIIAGSRAFHSDVRARGADVSKTVFRSLQYITSCEEILLRREMRTRSMLPAPQKLKRLHDFACTAVLHLRRKVM